MKVLILANNDVGLYQFRKELIEELLKHHDVYISLPYGELVEPLKEMGCHFIDTPVDRRGMNPIKDVHLLHYYWKTLKKLQPDMVITYTIKPNVYGGLCCRLQKIPYAVNITGLGTAFQKKGVLRNFVTFLYQTGLKKAKVVFFENSSNRDLFVREKIVKKQQCCLLHGAGVNLDHYQLMTYPKDCEETRFLFVGRVMKEKGIEELFHAMQKLHQEGYHCSLDILGGYEENLKGQMDVYESQGWLRYHGYQKDVCPFISQAHCFVLPSWHEGMANTNLECAACGRPVITSDIPGCREAVKAGKSGLLCQARDAESLYQAMKTFLSFDQSQRIQMGEAGRAHMIKYFDKKEVVQKTVNHIFNQV